MTRLRRDVSKSGRTVQLFKDGDTWIVSVWAADPKGGKHILQTATNNYVWANDAYSKYLDDSLLPSNLQPLEGSY